MASQVPAKLKTADLTRFIVRAAQLETAKPVVAYWCEYWIVNQILAKGLHNGDNETLQYTTTLMDKLEQIKSDNATNDAIIDDAAGQAYCEQFGLETFYRADRAVHADKVTKQTADTFQAAATFLELVNIWGTPDAETLGKIKYAKWNAVRIMKALKEGKDPNESNPKPEPSPEENLPPLDPNDPDVRSLEQHTIPKSAYVEEVPDEQDRIEGKLARQSSIDQSLHPSAQVSAQGSPRSGPSQPFDPYPKDGFPYNAVQNDGVSPMEVSPNPRNDSVGGGYFPEVPMDTSEPQDLLLSSAPTDLDLRLPQQPSAPPGFAPSPDFQSFPPPSIPDQPAVSPPPTFPPQDFYRQVPPPPNHFQGQAPPTNPPPPSQYIPAPIQPREQHIYQPPPMHPQPRHSYQSPPIQPSPPILQQQAMPPAARAMTNQQLNTDDVAIAKAQKHAKWAISALNFEDAETAVRELRAALQTLGAM